MTNPDIAAAAFCRASLAAYSIGRWPKYQVAKHIRLIAKALESVESGDCKRLMLFCPPRHGKSMLTSESFPAWLLGRNPAAKIIHSTYGQELADDFGRKIRNQLNEPLFKKAFPGCVLSKDSSSASRFTTTAGGEYFAVGIGGPMVGRGADYLLIDDPVKNRQDADSDTIRARLKDWYRGAAYTRLMPGGRVVIINTRWHHDDLCGWLIKNHQAENWKIISLPAIAEDADPMGRLPGEALWPEMFPADDLMQKKNQIGSREWCAQYQQHPTPDEGGLIRVAWFRRHAVAPVIPNRIIHSWDTGIKAEEINDPSACVCLHDHGSFAYIADVIRCRLEHPDLRRMVMNMAERDLPSAILIEDKGGGQSLIQDLQSSTRLPIIGINPGSAGKVIRAQAVSPLVEAGRIYLPEVASWLPDFETEVSQFPSGEHDDQVDALSQVLGYWRDTVIEAADDPFGTKPAPLLAGTM